MNANIRHLRALDFEAPSSLQVVQGQQPQRVESQVHEGVKRTFDIVMAISILTVLSPVILAIMLLTKVTSPGAIFYQQERVGQHGKKFNMLKFRSMIENAEKNTGPIWTTKTDHRVTPFGNFLRITHLDELPQLINVLKGDMSIIGPRPERPVFVEKFIEQGIPQYTARHLVKGGITGYAQITCPYPTLNQIGEKTEKDLWYIKNWSIKLDMWILWKTFTHLLHSSVDALSQEPSQ